jgi:hypothetical protein
MECDSVRIHARLQVCGLKREECRRSCREEGARGDAHNLGAEHLLPEERALIASLFGRPVMTDY